MGAPINSPSTLLLFLILSIPTLSSSLNISSILSSYPDLSLFASLLSPSILSDLSSRSSLTILAVPNSLLPHPPPPPSDLSSSLPFHVLLRFLSPQDLPHLPPSGTLFPTLLQSTSHSPSTLASLNLSFNPLSRLTSLSPPNSSSPSSTANILSLVLSLPYNLSIFTVSQLISPFTSPLTASDLRPPSPSVNITKSLIDAHSFNVAASMLSASGVIDEFEADESGAGITLFIPTDSAFANLPPDVHLQALPADKKALVLKFHVLHSYYPLGSLDSIVNPLQPTLATEANGAGSFTLNISKINGSVALNSGVVQAVVTQTVFDQNPVAIFGVSVVLLPREIFGDLKGKGVNLGMRNSAGEDPVADPPALYGANQPVGEPGNPDPGLRDEIKSDADCGIKNSRLAMAVLYLLLSSL